MSLKMPKSYYKSLGQDLRQPKFKVSEAKNRFPDPPKIPMEYMLSKSVEKRVDAEMFSLENSSNKKAKHIRLKPGNSRMYDSHKLADHNAMFSNR